MAKQQYLYELNNKVSWNNVAQNLKANYDKLDWVAINENVNKVLVELQIDSLQNVYSQALSELEKSQRSLNAKVKCTITPMPDASMEQIQQAKECLKKNLDSLKAVSARPKKIIQL